MQEVTPQEGLARVQGGALLVDVREQNEYDEVHAQGARLIPLSEFESRYAELPQDQEIVLICRSGARSGRATQFLMDQGYTRVANLQGGTLAWDEAGLPVDRA
ncbi:rhodanese-like domain-containing protein [Deinococcus ficus]|uniref:rhodanese-like domain-containing protein n=1 Tax=Deinococcus ficus TaxID=317577 RepID=UPI000409159C|nr:rhodanese-like domain-containing protein [Deinococcus ficus]